MPFSGWAALFRYPHKLPVPVSLLLCACLLSGSTLAEPLLLDGQVRGPLGVRAVYLSERGVRLSPGEAVDALLQGRFQQDNRAIPSFGIGAQPVWMYLPLHNPAANPLSLHLAVGKPWLDGLDIHLLRDGRIVRRWEGGDGHSLVPGVGYLYPLNLAPGHSGILIRAETAEPLVLEVSLLPQQGVAKRERRAHYRYGLLYGFLMAFILYNTMLYFGLRDRSNLYYALYLFSYVVLSLIYTGHGNAWLWPGNAAIERNGIPLMMVLFSSAGFLFACRFLQVSEHAPKILRWVEGVSISSICLVGVSILLDSQKAAVFVAFPYMVVFTIGMVGLGLVAIRHGERAGCYFLCAALCSMLGVSLTLFSVWGFLSVNDLTFHGVEVGLALEATLFSLALASRVRSQEDARRAAEQLSRLDALTGLPNRRAFYEDSAGVWSTALRHNRPLSVIMLDIDHFKTVNDRYGHSFGDRALVQVGRMLAQCCREGDRVARWGGEEFVVLLPETTLAQACLFAERLRTAVGSRKLIAGSQAVSLSISLGAAQRRSQRSLDELLCEADRKLYAAKQQGRNRVVPALPLQSAV